jgi:hypothetical protein
MPNSRSRLLTCAAASLFSIGARAQCLDWNPTFGADGIVGQVLAEAVYDDGTGAALYVGGGFTAAGGLSANNFAKWNGVGWSTMGTTLSGGIIAMVVFDDGTGPALYIAGGFGSVNGHPASHVAKWNGVSWSSLGSGTNAAVNALCVFDDGNGPALYAGGGFSSAGGVGVGNIARWDGVHWSAVGDGNDGVGGGVRSLTVFDSSAGSRLVVGGTFLGAGGVFSNNLIAWDGTSWLPVGGGVDGAVNALRQFDDGQGNALYVGGSFGVAGTIAASRVARWDGSNWSPLGSGVDGTVQSLCEFDDGTGAALHVGGNFTNAGGSSAHAIARWNGASWSPLAGGLDYAQAPATAYALLSSGAFGSPALFAGGFITHSENLSTQGIARWNGASWSHLGPPGDNAISGIVNELAVFDGGGGPELVASGSFGLTGYQHVDYIAKWNGSSWSPLGNGLASRAYALCVFDDGGGSALYAAATPHGSPEVSQVIRWDGSSWSTLPGSPTANAAILALQVFDDGGGPALYVAGAFTSIGGVSANRIAKWNGVAFAPLAGGITGGSSPYVGAMIVHDGGGGPALYVGGTFNSAGDGPAANIAKWNGAHWSALASGTNNTVNCLATFDDGGGSALYAGGAFFTAGGAPVSYVAKWNGSAWSAVGGGANGALYTLCAFDDGAGPALFAGGVFTSAGSVAAGCFARWNGSSWSAPGSFAHDSAQPTYLNAMAAFDDGTGGGPDLYIGGFFDSVGNTGASNIAEWRGCAAPIATFCAGDLDSPVPCPCANTGLLGRGCENSFATGGALLDATGTTQPDTIVLHASHELPSVLSTFLQGSASIPAVSFGDGLRCVGGSLKRLYVKNASAGAVDAPTGSDPSITARSAALGDTILPGSTRYYQTYYRDSNLAFCAAPVGNSWNVTNGVKITW